MAARPNAPVIVKRKKVAAAQAHHGGAWKVAYADFVTAMMAFFMLMWLLNATTEKQRKGIADYFDPTVQISRTSSGGQGLFGGESVFSEDTLARNGLGGMVELPLEPDDADRAGDDAEKLVHRAAFSDLEQRLVGSGGESLVSDQLLRHVVTRQTDEGLIVELFDLPGAPLFAAEGAEPTPVMRQIAGQLADVFGLVTNDVAVGAHVAVQPVVRTPGAAWDLSSERAEASRRLLEAAGLRAERVRRVTGHADRTPVAANPFTARNNRVEIVLLREDR